MRAHQVERHFVTRLGWLRAAVLGANDGILSTGSLMVGVASANGSAAGVLIAGISGLVAGAMSMAAGEFVSVSSQSDSERADLTRERSELRSDPQAETAELAAIYMKRGLEKQLARQVAEQLMAKDALAAHARDELGISEETAARPIQAALASAASFIVGGALPLVAAIVSPRANVAIIIAVTSLVVLAVLGAVGGKRRGRADAARDNSGDLLGSRRNGGYGRRRRFRRRPYFRLRGWHSAQASIIVVVASTKCPATGMFGKGRN
jgi:vacuolar iron transporter family protein